MPTLLIVDDHAAVRAGLAALIAPEPDLRVVATAADAEAALAHAEEHRPDVALIDFHLPGEDGLELCLRLDGVAPRPADPVPNPDLNPPEARFRRALHRRRC